MSSVTSSQSDRFIFKQAHSDYYLTSLYFYIYYNIKVKILEAQLPHETIQGKLRILSLSISVNHFRLLRYNNIPAYKVKVRYRKCFAPTSQKFSFTFPLDFNAGIFFRLQRRKRPTETDRGKMKLMDLNGWTGNIIYFLLSLGTQTENLFSFLDVASDDTTTQGDNIFIKLPGSTFDPGKRCYFLY